MKQKFLLSILTCGLLLGSTGLYAKTDKKVLIQNEVQHEMKARKQAPKEIVAGMQQTYAAIQALHQHKKDDAKKALKSAEKNFDTALKANPALDIVPIDERFQAYAFTGSSKAINARIKLTEQLLKDHDTQEAIAMLAPLKDELTITVVSIPMKLYPKAVKSAIKSLDKGDEKSAYTALAGAMNSLVIAEATLPTTLLAAEDLLTDASKLDKTKKAEATKLLESAKEELKRAELLGYASKHSAAYKSLNDSIDKIEKEIKGKNEVEKLYDTVISDFKHMIENSKISKVKDPAAEQKKAEKKVDAYQEKEAAKADKETNEFKTEVTKDENKTIK